MGKGFQLCGSNRRCYNDLEEVSGEIGRQGDDSGSEGNTANNHHSSDTKGIVDDDATEETSKNIDAYISPGAPLCDESDDRSGWEISQEEPSRGGGECNET